MEESNTRAPIFGLEAWGPLEAALAAYSSGIRDVTLTVLADEGEPEPMPVSLFFRGREDLREADGEALARARGRVLDVGAGVGSLSLLLQEDGLEVTAVEVIPEAVGIMRDRGVGDVHEGRMEQLPATRSFDTILLMMNGAALAGTLEGLPFLLQTLDGLLAPWGQILMDSTDLLDGEDWEVGEEPPSEVGSYPGELQYQLEYDGERGAPFPQLFVDPRTLGRIGKTEGWRVALVWEGPQGEYLARLTRSEEPEPAPVALPKGMG